MRALSRTQAETTPIPHPKADGVAQLAELALSLMLETARSEALRGKTLGLVGFGRVAQAVAQRAHHGLGMQVTVYSPTPIDAARLQAVGASPVSSLRSLLAQADVVSHHSADPNLRITGAMIDIMRPDATLVHIGAPEAVDQIAVAQALMFGLIRGAGVGLADGARLHPLLAQCDGFATRTQPDLAART